MIPSFSSHRPHCPQTRSHRSTMICATTTTVLSPRFSISSLNLRPLICEFTSRWMHASSWQNFNHHRSLSRSVLVSSRLCTSEGYEELRNIFYSGVSVLDVILFVFFFKDLKTDKQTERQTLSRREAMSY